MKGFTQMGEPVTQDQLLSIIDSLIAKLENYMEYGLIIGEDTDSRVVAAQDRISANRMKIAKDRELIRKVKATLKRKRELDK